MNIGHLTNGCKHFLAILVQHDYQIYVIL